MEHFLATAQSLAKRAIELPFIEGDERTRDWPCMSYEATLFFGIGYVVFTLLGLQVMKGRKPYDLLLVRKLHNLAMTLLSLYMTVEIAHQCIVLGFLSPLDRTEKGLDMAKVLYIFYISKIFEFMDTAIMILRCKFDQVSFLHVYHHATVFWIWWLNVKVYPGGESALAALMNSFVHVVMYFYYFLTTIEIYPWWKKYITQLQLTQFVAMIVQGVGLTIYGQEGFRALATINGTYAVTLFFLFQLFYAKTYKKKDGKGEEGEGKKPAREGGAPAKTTEEKKGGDAAASRASPARSRTRRDE